MEAERPEVTIVVLSYDGRELLEVVLPTLARQTFPSFSVLVVDNGSSDGSAEYLEREWPQVEILRLPENIGVAAALNRGVEAARSEFVALLNNDIELEPDWLAELVAALRSHPEAGSATGKMLNFHRRDRLDGAGDVVMWSGAATRRGFETPDEGQFDRPEAVFGACGGAALYRRVAFDAVGPFDEDFFAYMEDVDWSFRAQLAGFACRYVPSAVAYHMAGATTGRNISPYLYMQRRNQLWMMAKNYPARAFVLHAPKILLFQLGFVASSVRDGVLGAHARAWGEALRGMPGVLQKRRAIQGARRVGLRYLDTLVAPEPYAADTRIERLRSMASAAAPLFGRRGRR